MAAIEDRGEEKRDAYELASVNEKLVEETNTGIERAKNSHVLKGKKNKLKEDDLIVNKKLERTRLRFKELRSNFKSLR